MVESGIVSVRKAIDIIIQTAEALETAHKKGILHRDVKSANIMVSMEGRVKVMDFGLAHLEERSQLTRTGTTMGTLSYSSPEHISGRAVDKRSEIFSLGVVFYELLTGQLPFKASNEAEILFAIINNEPPKLTSVREDVPELVEAVVSRMVEKNPELRYQTCGEVIHDLEGIRKEMETSTVSITGALERVKTERKRQLLTRLALGFGAGIAAVVAAILFFPGRPDLDPDRVMVAIFENRTGDSSLDEIGTMAASWISEGITRTEIAQVVPFTTVLQASQYLSSKLDEIGPGGTVQRLSRDTGAGIAVSGTFYLENSALRFQTEIIDCRTGTAIHHVEPVSGPASSPIEIVESVRGHVITYLGMHYDSEGMSSWMGGTPPTLEAFVAFSQGLQLIFRGQQEEAVEAFYLAASEGDMYLSPLVYAPISLLTLGRMTEADSLTQYLELHRDRLTNWEKSHLDWSLALISGDLDVEYRAVREMARISPIEAAFYAGFTCMRCNRPQEAIEHLSRADMSSQWAREWPPYWARYASAYERLGEHRLQFKIIRRGRTIHSDVFLLLNGELRALAALGRFKNIERLLEESRSLPPTEGYSYGGSLRVVARYLRFHGYKDECIPFLEQAVEWYRSRPEEERHNLRSSLGNTYYHLEMWKEARSIFEQLKVEFPDDADYLGYLGCLAARRGDVENARLFSEQLAALDAPYLLGNHTYWRGCIASLLGDKEKAVAFIRESFEQGIDYDRPQTDMDLEPLRDFPPYIELMRPKG
jgi:tetratricopeptide (TPR) repeat protein